MGERKGGFERENRIFIATRIKPREWVGKDPNQERIIRNEKNKNKKVKNKKERYTFHKRKIWETHNNQETMVDHNNHRHTHKLTKVVTLLGM